MDALRLIEIHTIQRTKQYLLGIQESPQVTIYWPPVLANKKIK